jgi:hypothetical protein
MTDTTLLAGSHEPAHVVGHGPIPADLARRLVHDTDKAWIRRLYAHPGTGSLNAADSRRRCFPRRIRRQLVLASGTCAMPGCDAPARHADHVTPVRDGGSTTETNATGLCEACNAHLGPARLDRDPAHLVRQHPGPRPEDPHRTPTTQPRPRPTRHPRPGEPATTRPVEHRQPLGTAMPALRLAHGTRHVLASRSQ